MARLLIARHGQSEWNAVGRWQGQADPPLTELGVQQARAAALGLGTFDAIAASNLERARHTAECVAEHLGIGPVIIDPDLMERDAGEWSGLTKAEIEEQDPGALAAWRTPPGFESDESLELRVCAALGRLASTVGDDGEVFIVSHGGVLHTLEQLLLDDAERSGPFSNLSALWLRVEPGVLRIEGRVELLDDSGVAVTTPTQI